MNDWDVLVAQKPFSILDLQVDAEGNPEKSELLEWAEKVVALGDKNNKIVESIRNLKNEIPEDFVDFAFSVSYKRDRDNRVWDFEQWYHRLVKALEGEDSDECDDVE